MAFDKTTIARNALESTQRIINACGPRLAGSSSNKHTAELLKDELTISSDKVHVEEFTFHRGAMYSSGYIFTVSYLIAASILFVGGASVYFSLAVFIFGIIYVFLQGTAFMEVFDFLFPKATGWNVYGVVEPKEDVKQQVIVAGHHDTAYVFRWLLRWQKLYVIRIILNMILTFYLLWSFSFGVCIA